MIGSHQSCLGIFVRKKKGKKNRRTKGYVRIFCALARTIVPRIFFRQCAYREINSICILSALAGIFFHEAASPIGRDGFIQLIRVTPRNTRFRPRRTRPRGFRLAVGTRAQVEVWFLPGSSGGGDDDDDVGGGGGSSGGGGFLRQPRAL